MKLKVNHSRLRKSFSEDEINDLAKAVGTKQGQMIGEAILKLLKVALEETDGTYTEELANPAYPFIRAYRDGRRQELKTLGQIFEE